MADPEAFARPWLLHAAKALYIAGSVFKPRASPDNQRTFQKILKWNARYFAPAVEKCLDAIVLRDIMRRKIRPGDRILFQAVNNARFEDDVLEGLDISSVFIDANDLAIQFDYDEKTLRDRKWINDILIGSYDDVAEPGRLYDAIICNNGYSATKNIGNTMLAQRKALKENGLLIFNLHFPLHVHNIMAVNKLHSILKMDFGEYKRFGWIEKQREVNVGKDINQILDMAPEMGYRLLEVKPYLHGWYRAISNMFIWPIYMKYFQQLSSDNEIERWHALIEGFKEWFLEYGSRYADSQTSGALIAKKSAKAYFVLEKNAG